MPPGRIYGQKFRLPQENKDMVYRYKIEIKLPCNGSPTTSPIKLLLILGAEHFMHVVFYLQGARHSPYTRFEEPI